MDDIGLGSSAFDAGQRAVLERIAQGDPLGGVLADIVRLIERQAEGMYCSVLLYDEARRCVRHGASPSLPAEYSALLDGLEVGPQAGSCGAAAYLGERVVVEDIATHPNWESYRDLALPHGLRACWSTPVFAPDRRVLGTFAMYYREPRGPTAEEMAWVDAASHLTAIAILKDRSEAALRESEERLRSTIEHTPDVAIQWYDEDGRILFHNRASERLFGWAPGQALGKTLLELGFWTSEEESRFTGERAAAARGEQVKPVEFCYRRGDGSEGFLLSTVFRIPSSGSTSYGIERAAHPPAEAEPASTSARPALRGRDGGRPLVAGAREASSAGACYVCMDVDLTERRRMEDAVHASERLRALIYDIVEDGVFYLAVEGPDRYRFLSVNPAFVRATGLRRSDVVGCYLHDVVSEPERSRILARNREAVSTGQKISWDEVGRFPAGIRHGEVTLCPIADAHGRVTHLLGTVHDIAGRLQAEDERRRLEGLLHRSQRLQALGTLASGVAHDFGNILAAVSANAELALMELAEDHPSRANLVDIQRASRRAGELVRQILAFARDQPRRLESVDLRGVIDDALDLLRVSMPKQVQVRRRIGTDEPRVTADRTQLHQVMLNLLSNALYALRDRRAASLEVTIDEVTVGGGADSPAPDLAEGQYLRVGVIDDGCGMDESTARHACDPFFTTKAAGEGTGLGLSVVHGIVRNHGGAITIESEVGRGTAVHFYLPARHAPARQECASTVAGGRGRSVLYVDDEEALVYLASRVLTRFGYRVTGYSDAVKALHDFRAHPGDFDVVVSDVAMPGLSGHALAESLLALRRDLPIVLLSGYLRPEDARFAAELGIRHVMLKPSTVEEMARTLAPVIDELVA